MEMSFFPKHGSGPLDVHLKAKTAKESIPTDNGYYWLGANGELEGVQFEDVAESSDSQKIVTESGEWVAVKIANGEITISSSLMGRKSA